jgi:hypothetical protein
MRSFRLAFLAHIALGIAAVLALYFSTPLQDWEAALLWFFGLPWLAGFIAFFVWPTRNWVLAWTLPAVTFVIGFSILLVAEWAAGAT